MEDAYRQLLTEYEPIDISTIKTSRVSSEKEFEQEANSICELLKDISRLTSSCLYVEGDWNQRLKALLTVQSFIVTEDVRAMSNYFNFTSKMVAPITIQLTDLRSQITKEASRVISIMA